MNWRISAATAALLILPIGALAAIPEGNNNLSESITTTRQIAQMRHGKRGRGEGMNRLLQQLDLTSEQSEQIAAIKEQSQTDKEALYQQMQTEQEEMRSLLSSDATPEQLTQQHQQLQDLRQQAGDKRFATMLEIREILTPEQRSQMAESIAERGDRKGQRGR